MATLNELATEFANRGVFYNADEALGSLAGSPFMADVDSAADAFIPSDVEAEMRGFYLAHWSYRR